MANIPTPKSAEQKRLETLYGLVGDRAVNADRNMNLLRHVNTGLLTAVGLLVGGIVGKRMSDGSNDNTMLGTAIGGALGLGTALIGHSAGKDVAKLSMGKYDRKELRDAYLDPSALGYVIPGYAGYQQQRIDDLANAQELQHAQFNQPLRKKGAVFTEKDVKQMIETAEKNKLRGRDIFQRYSPKQIARLANGIGPSWEPEWFAKTLNWLMPWGKVPAVIHDLEWAEGTGNAREFHRSNERFLANNKKLQGPTSVLNPTRLLPLALFYAVESNRPHYVTGKTENPYYPAANKSVETVMPVKI
jgi:hypothetical protein